MVEHLPRDSKVKGSSPGTNIDAETERKWREIFFVNSFLVIWRFANREKVRKNRFVENKFFEFLFLQSFDPPEASHSCKEFHFWNWWRPLQNFLTFVLSKVFETIRFDFHTNLWFSEKILKIIFLQNFCNDQFCKKVI